MEQLKYLWKMFRKLRKKLGSFVDEEEDLFGMGREQARGFYWVEDGNNTIQGNEATGPNKILIGPAVSSGQAELVVEVSAQVNQGIGFSNHNHADGPLAASWVGGGQESYSIWNHGTQCGADAEVKFEAGEFYQQATYKAIGDRVRMLVDMTERTFDYYINDQHVGRFVNIPQEISFVAYVGGGAFRIVSGGLMLAASMEDYEKIALGSYEEDMKADEVDDRWPAADIVRAACRKAGEDPVLIVQMLDHNWVESVGDLRLLIRHNEFERLPWNQDVSHEVYSRICVE